MQSSSRFFFPVISFSCEGSLFFGQSSKRLYADRLRCEHRCFYMATSVRLVLYILADLGPCSKLLTSFLVHSYARLARTASRNCARLFLPATILLASFHKTHVYTRHYAIFKRYTCEPTQNKLNRYKMVNVTTAGAHSVSNLPLYYTYTHTTFLCKSRPISRMTLGTIKKLEFQQQLEDSHLWSTHKRPPT